MKKQILWVAGLLATMVIACSPDANNPNPPTPGPDTTRTDTTHKDTTDTIRHDTIPTIDTIRTDTMEFDSIVNLDNDRVVCSYVEWYCRSNNLIKGLYNYVTNICFAFAELYVKDGVYQKFDLSGGSSAWTLFKQVVALKEKKPDLKIQVSFSHVVENSDNSQGGGFSAMAKSQEQMSHFAHDCKEFCKKWNIDGIDIDWELPGISWSGHACDPAVDTENYVKLMKTLRDTLPFGEYLLTYAGYPKDKEQVSGGWQFIDNMAVEPYVDWFNVMTYDMGSGINSTPHNAIDATGGGSFDWDIKHMYNEFNKLGYPMHKMVLGLAFYGRVQYDEKPQTYDYWQIEQNIKKGTWTRYFHNVWKVPYVRGGGKMICSYDDPESIAYKGKWAMDRGMRGFMWWAQGGDNDKRDLTRASWNALKTRTDHYRYYIYHLSDSTTIVTEPFIVEQ